jgi:choline dehydrogenase-like flavoprotein
VDVLVVGAGIVGCTAAALLAGAGAEVIVLDRAGIAADGPHGGPLDPRPRGRPCGPHRRGDVDVRRSRRLGHLDRAGHREDGVDDLLGRAAPPLALDPLRRVRGR